MALELQAHCLDYQILAYHLVLASITCMVSALVWSRLFLAFGLTPPTVARSGIVDNWLHQVDSRLLLIKPPSAITRAPRSIESHRKHWKG